MLEFVSVFFAVLIGVLIALQTSLQNGSLLRFIDSHPNPKVVPPVAYVAGHGFYLVQDLEMATTFFYRITRDYSTSPYADDAYFYYIQALDDQSALPRQDLADLYKDYLEKFPTGKHATVAAKRQNSYRSGTSPL